MRDMVSGSFSTKHNRDRSTIWTVLGDLSAFFSASPDDWSVFPGVVARWGFQQVQRRRRERGLL